MNPSPAEITLYVAAFLCLAAGIYRIHRARAARRWVNYRAKQDKHITGMAFRQAKEREGDRNWNN